MIIDGVSFPLGLAIDGAGNIWVQNGGNNVTVYAPPVLTHAGVPTLVQTFGLTGLIYGIAVSEGTIGWSTSSTVLFGSTTTAIGSDNPEGLVREPSRRWKICPSPSPPMRVATLYCQLQWASECSAYQQ